jgi:small-conductance mechanosensitive channel
MEIAVSHLKHTSVRALDLIWLFDSIACLENVMLLQYAIVMVFLQTMIRVAKAISSASSEAKPDFRVPKTLSSMKMKAYVFLKTSTNAPCTAQMNAPCK